MSDNNIPNNIPKTPGGIILGIVLNFIWGGLIGLVGVVVGVGIFHLPVLIVLGIGIVIILFTDNPLPKWLSRFLK